MLTDKQKLSKSKKSSHVRPEDSHLKPTGKAVFHDNAKNDPTGKVIGEIQTMVNAYSEDLNTSIELHKLGAKTELTAEIEKFLAQPLDGLYKLHTKLEEDIKSIIDIHIQQFLKSKSDLVHSAFRTKTEFNDLHYCIVLNEDTLDNRLDIFDFYNDYDLSALSDKFPVYIQFVPLYLIDKINIDHPLVLA